VALESARARCLVVGEDLGTVPEGLREQLDAAAVLSYRVLWFERAGTAFRPPAAYPSLAVACVATHDLATLAGWWAGADIAERVALGLLDAAGAAAAQAERAAERAELAAALAAHGVWAEPIDPTAPLPDAAAAAVHRYIADTPSALVMAQADDMAGETSGVNLPGTDTERPNWRRRIAVPAAALFAAHPGAAIIQAFRAARAGSAC
jgi:glycogen operon protein